MHVCAEDSVEVFEHDSGWSVSKCGSGSSGSGEVIGGWS
jgi:hypothetical protein